MQRDLDEGEVISLERWDRAAVRWFAAGLTLVRRDVQRREPAGAVMPTFDPEDFRARFAHLRRGDHLGGADTARLHTPFERHPCITAG